MRYAVQVTVMKTLCVCVVCALGSVAEAVRQVIDEIKSYREIIALCEKLLGYGLSVILCVAEASLI